MTPPEITLKGERLPWPEGCERFRRIYPKVPEFLLGELDEVDENVWFRIDCLDGLQLRDACNEAAMWFLSEFVRILDAEQDAVIHHHPEGLDFDRFATLCECGEFGNRAEAEKAFANANKWADWRDGQNGE